MFTRVIVTVHCKIQCIKLCEPYVPVTVHRNRVLCNNQPDALIIQIYSVIKLHMFWASSPPIMRSPLLYIRHL